jgi:hypothetical protein
MRSVLAVITLVLVSAVASAQSRPATTTRPSEPASKSAATPRPSEPAPKPADSRERVVFKKRTIIDFTGALIEGDLIKPEGSYVVSRKASRFSTLIRVREHFLPELIASPNDL